MFLITLPRITITGVIMDILTGLTSDLNFVPQMFMRIDREWGSHNSSTGDSTGIVASATHGDVDLIVANLDMSPARVHVLKWLAPIMEQRMAFVISKSWVKEEVSWMVFVQPFSRVQLNRGPKDKALNIHTL